MLKWLYEKIAPKNTTKQLSSPESRSAARDAVKNASVSYAEARAKKERVEELVTKLREQRERNHFADLITETMKGAG